MRVNDLVIVKSLNQIGCISKVGKNSYRVNVGLDDVITLYEKDMTLIDVSKCKTISFSKWQQQTLTNTVEDDYIVVGNVLKHYVGVGWVDIRVVTPDDLRAYKRVI